MVHLTALLQDRQPFRRERGRHDRYILAPDEDMTDFVFQRVERYAPPQSVNSMLHRFEVRRGPGIESWGTPADYLSLLSDAAEVFDMSVEEAAIRFGGLELRENTQGWRYNPGLGFGSHLI